MLVVTYTSTCLYFSLRILSHHVGPSRSEGDSNPAIPRRGGESEEKIGQTTRNLSHQRRTVPRFEIARAEETDFPTVSQTVVPDEIHGYELMIVVRDGDGD